MYLCICEFVYLCVCVFDYINKVNSQQVDREGREEPSSQEDSGDGGRRGKAGNIIMMNLDGW